MNPTRKWTLVPSLVAGLAMAACGTPEAGPPVAETSLASFLGPWLPLTQGGASIGDPLRDGGGLGREIVGSATLPAMFYFVDGTDFHVRLRIDVDPRATVGVGLDSLRQLGWGLVFDTDGDSADYEFSLIIGKNGPSGNQIVFGENMVRAGTGRPNDSATNRYEIDEVWPAGVGNTTDTCDDPNSTNAATCNTEVRTANSCFDNSMNPAGACGGVNDAFQDYFLDFAIPLGALTCTSTTDRVSPCAGALGGVTWPFISTTTPLVVWGGTSSSAQSISVDLAGSTGTLTLIGTGSDPISLPGVCGNGIPEVGEACDDGDGDDTNVCSNACLINSGNPCAATGNVSCASGICDTTETPDRCEAVGACGNGVVEGTEGCDDGGVADGDGCSAGCRIETGGACNTSGVGATGGSSCASGLCDTTETPDRCEATGACGNGVVDDALEGCDDGNVASGDGCNPGCLVEVGGSCNLLPPGATGDASCSSGSCDLIALPPTCAASVLCGNALLDPGEGCDDGDTDAGDGCDATCLIEDGGACNATAPGLTDASSCASGICDATETPDRCEAAGACGNGVLDAGEGCDDGGVTDGDGCSVGCLVETGETCGTGGGASCASGLCDTTETPDRCEAVGACGNGVVDDAEGCDDGNVAGGDGCSVGCLVELGGECNLAPPGATGDASCATGTCNLAGLPPTCVVSGMCGNAVLEPGEGCDDGNADPGDGCGATCFVEDGGACNATGPGRVGGPSCESGICDVSETPDRCEAVGACGNGVLEGAEGCDDGGVVAGDGCSVGCRIETGGACNTSGAGATGEPSCASGICDTTEEPDRCEAAGACGNAVLEAGEGCDDGGVVGGDGCSVGCRVETGGACGVVGPGLVGGPSCASGICDTTEGPDRCEAAGACGNGVVEAGEGCDDGGVTDGGGCAAGCLVELGGTCNATVPGLVGDVSCVSGVCDTSGTPDVCVAGGTCGNGVLEPGEGCDDGDTAVGDGCNGSCRVELGAACNATAPGLLGDASCASGSCDTTDGAPGVCGDATDTDLDGVPDARDLDDDDDGLPDTEEASRDTDGDGVLDRRDLDSDGDGLVDAAEAGHGLVPADGATRAACPGGVGVNGLCDALETDPDSGVLDYDGDGSADGVPRDADGDQVPDYRDLDADDDGLVDAIEAGHALGDAGGDGLADCASGVGTDGVCADLAPVPARDTDGDGTPDVRDLDSDDDGAFDAGEAGSGCQGAAADGVCDGGDPDGDGLVGSIDGAPEAFGDDAALPAPDTDGDGTPDVRDLDSDNDGRSDLVEAGTGCGDPDDDGVCDGADADGDGLVDAIDGAAAAFGSAGASALPDADGDGMPDLREVDSDGDGTTDLDEDGRGDLDDDGDGRVDDSTDADGDGIADGIDDLPGQFGGLGDGVEPPDDDRDDDGVVDEDDNCVDVPNAAQEDRDADGMGDACDRDADGDGFYDDVGVSGGGCTAAPGGGRAGTSWVIGALLLAGAWLGRRRRLGQRRG